MQQALKTMMSQIPDGIDAVIITSDLNRRYFTGMKSSAGTLLVTRKAAHLIIDFRYIEKARQVITDFDVELQGSDIFPQIDAFFKAQQVKTVGVEASVITVQSFKKYEEKLTGYEFSDTAAVTKLINSLRAVKTPEEIEKIKKAQAVTDKTFSYMCDYIKPGMTELAISIELEYRLRCFGGTGIAFDSIVVSGVNSALPHGVPTEKKVEKGDLLTMDFGASYDGYCSDMTRTVAIGEISEEQQRVYDTVLKAQLLALDSIKPGREFKEVDKIARDFIDEAGYKGCFGHGLGHSLGLYIHEDPRFDFACSDPIGGGVIMTVEPGIYINGKFGVRIEDMVLITKNGCTNLTSSVKNLITL